MLVRENILKNSKLTTRWSKWSESDFTVEDNIMTTTGGTSTLKAYYSVRLYSSNPIIVGHMYEVSLYIENLGSSDLQLYINGLNADRVRISPGFKGTVSISGVKDDRENLLQIQLLTYKVEDDIKAYIDEILVSEYTNLVSISSIDWYGFNQAVITQEGEVVSATAGDKTSNLKAYGPLNSKLSDTLMTDEEYTISFYFENLTSGKLWVKILGFNDSYKTIDADFKGILTYTDKRKIVNEGEPLQIQVSNLNKDEGVKFIVKDVYLYKNRDDKEERPWIPAKADLKNSSLYPKERYYKEVICI